MEMIYTSIVLWNTVLPIYDTNPEHNHVAIFRLPRIYWTDLSNEGGEAFRLDVLYSAHTRIVLLFPGKMLCVYKDLNARYHDKSGFTDKAGCSEAHLETIGVMRHYTTKISTPIGYLIVQWEIISNQNVLYSKKTKQHKAFVVHHHNALNDYELRDAQLFVGSTDSTTKWIGPPDQDPMEMVGWRKARKTPAHLDYFRDRENQIFRRT